MIVVKPLTPPFDDEISEIIESSIVSFYGDNFTATPENYICMRAKDNNMEAGICFGYIKDDIVEVLFLSALDDFGAELLLRGLLNKALNIINQRKHFFAKAVSYAYEEASLFKKVGFKANEEGILSAGIEDVLTGRAAGGNSCSSCSLKTDCNSCENGCS